MIHLRRLKRAIGDRCGLTFKGFPQARVIVEFPRSISRSHLTLFPAQNGDKTDAPSISLAVPPIEQIQ